MIYYIAELRDIEVIAHPSEKPQPKVLICRLNLSVGWGSIPLANSPRSESFRGSEGWPGTAGFFHLGGTAGQISLDDENFAFLRIPALQACVAVKRKISTLSAYLS